MEIFAMLTALTDKNASVFIEEKKTGVSSIFSRIRSNFYQGDRSFNGDPCLSTMVNWLKGDVI